MRIVIKIGTSTLTYATGNMNLRRVEELCKVIADIKNAGNEVILVSSGAIAMGVGKLGLRERPHDIAGKQACAAVGQCELMYVYDRVFSEYNHTVAQLLLTGEDLHDAARYENFSNTMNELLRLGVLPVINENDTVATGEIAVGDNDTLGAIVAVSVHADLLILLSDIEGLYTADPHKEKSAKLISRVEKITPEIEALAGEKGSERGTGGMKTKLSAAKICAAGNCETVIANGETPASLYRIVNGENVGTRFCCGG
ncbi:MAG: glutamate 5-kinase [Candidatus Borkfalkiaceae bacterium]|nr:glutamate 5-kinase [Clostridia bacterium]MDY6224179.1 glutamate 5-kinase [Christensenellaceae bacterium]